MPARQLRSIANRFSDGYDGAPSFTSVSKSDLQSVKTWTGRKSGGGCLSLLGSQGEVLPGPDRRKEQHPPLDHILASLLHHCGS
eukprot:1309144-Amphidinium_carterae.1